MQLSRSEHEERERIAQLLHDDLQQLLFGLKLKLGLLYAQSAAAIVQQEIKQIEDGITEAIVLTRELNADLNPPILHDVSLVNALQWLGTACISSMDLN